MKKLIILSMLAISLNLNAVDFQEGDIVTLTNNGKEAEAPPEWSCSFAAPHPAFVIVKNTDDKTGTIVQINHVRYGFAEGKDTHMTIISPNCIKLHNSMYPVSQLENITDETSLVPKSEIEYSIQTPK